MPNLKIITTELNATYTLSSLFLNDKLLCKGFEDEIRKVKVHGETAIPRGTYKVGLRQSPALSQFFFYNKRDNILVTSQEYTHLSVSEQSLYKQHDMLWFMNVPNYQYVMLHWGNFTSDTEGCFLVGDSYGQIYNPVTKQKEMAILNSKDTYKKIYTLIYPLIAQGISIEIS